MGIGRANSGTGFYSDGFRPTGVTPLIIFGCVWAAFGIASFFLISHWEHEYNRKMAMISAGRVQPQTLYVTRIVHRRNGGDWRIGLNPRPGSSGSNEPYWTTVTKLDGLANGTPVPAYLIDRKWFVPRFSGGFGWGKWLALAFGLIPPLLLEAMALAIIAARKRAAMRPTIAPDGGERARADAVAMPSAGRPPAAMDGHWPVETLASYERHFGRGYTILFWIFFVSVVSLIIYVGRSPPNSPEVFRRLGLLLMDFGGGFLAILVYQCVVVKAFAHVVRHGGVFETRITTAQGNPLRYWIFVVLASIVMLGLVSGGLWLHLHAGLVHSKLQGQIQN